MIKSFLDLAQHLIKEAEYEDRYKASILASDMTLLDKQKSLSMLTSNRDQIHRFIRSKGLLHIRLTMNLSGDIERDHAVPLKLVTDAIWTRTMDIDKIAELLQHCLVTVTVSRDQHRLLNRQFRDTLPAPQDLLTCDVLARYRVVFPEHVDALDQQLTAHRRLMKFA